MKVSISGLNYISLSNVCLLVQYNEIFTLNITLKKEYHYNTKIYKKLKLLVCSQRGGNR